MRRFCNLPARIFESKEWADGRVFVVTPAYISAQLARPDTPRTFLAGQFVLVPPQVRVPSLRLPIECNDALAGCLWERRFLFARQAVEVSFACKFTFCRAGCGRQGRQGRAACSNAEASSQQRS